MFLNSDSRAGPTMALPGLFRSTDDLFYSDPSLRRQGYRMFKSMSTRKLSSQAARLSLPRNEVFVSG